MRFKLKSGQYTVHFVLKPFEPTEIELPYRAPEIDTYELMNPNEYLTAENLRVMVLDA